MTALRNGLGDRQPNAVLPAAALIEALKHMGQVLAADTGAVVGDTDQNGLLLRPAGCNSAAGEKQRRFASETAANRTKRFVRFS